MKIILDTPEKFIARMPSNLPLANALRRSVSEIPTLAVDEVEIYKNDSALYDEMLAHRIGLVPLRTEKSMNSKTKIELKLSKTGPCTVYSKDLEGNAKVVYENIPLTILKEGYKLELVATAILGKGIEHAKYLPGLVFYRNLLEIKSSTKIDEIISNSKNNIIKPEKKGDKWICDLNDTEVNKILEIDKKAVKDAEEILFIVESFGMMDAKTIFQKAIEVLEENLDEFEKFIEKS